MTHGARQPPSNFDGDQGEDFPDFGQPAYELPGYGEQVRPRKQGVRWGWVIGILAFLLLVLVIAAELIARMVVGGVVASQVEESMPDGLEAQVEASTTGWCVLCELAVGELSGLRVDGQNVEFGEARGDIDIDVESITLSDPVVIGAVEGTVRISEGSLNRILAETTAAYGFEMRGIDLNDGSFGYSTTVDVFGAEVVVDIEASVRIQSGGRIQILAEHLSIKTGGVGTEIPVDPERFTLEFCVAEHLPEMLKITAVEVVDDGLEIGYRSTESFAITDDVFQSRGSCSPA